MPAVVSHWAIARGLISRESPSQRHDPNNPSGSETERLCAAPDAQLGSWGAECGRQQVENLSALISRAQIAGLLGQELRRATAHTKLLNFASNAGPLLFFVLGGKVVWVAGLAMAAGQVIGARLGANAVLARGPNWCARS